MHWREEGNLKGFVTKLTFLGCSADQVGVREVKRLLQVELPCYHVLHLVTGIDIEPAEISIKVTGHTSLEQETTNLTWYRIN